MKNPTIYTKEETAELREKIINSEIVPIVKLLFSKYHQLRSAMLLVAQYWNDEANDAVHYKIIFSVLPTPALGVELVEDECCNMYDPINLPGLPSLDEIENEADCTLEDAEYYWNDNSNAVSMFAAYCKEDCVQQMGYLNAYTPYAVFRHKNGNIEIEVVGTMLRPWLDGVLPDEFS